MEKTKTAQELIDEVTEAMIRKQQPDAQMFAMVRKKMDQETLELLNRSEK